MNHWFDAHNHLQDPRLGDAASVVSAMREAGVGRCVVNATREDDWENVSKLAVDYADFVIPAYGIHPWHAHTASDGWQDRLRKLLKENPHASIGECGLDRWVESPEIEVQRPIFLDQLAIARELDRTVTIHCLKAWGPLFDAFQESPPPRRFLMHSYHGSIETARQLLEMGAWFSFSGHFLQERKSSVRDTFRQLPHDRILLETDAPDMLPPADAITHPLPSGCNHPANLPSIGRRLGASLERPDIAALTRRNAERCFGFRSPLGNDLPPPAAAGRLRGS